jgi:hypothetical protein
LGGNLHRIPKSAIRNAAELRSNIRVQRLDSLLGRLRQCSGTLPDKRRGMNTTYSAAFSVFFVQSPSFLAYERHLQEGHGRSNCEGLFGISKIPSDSHIRDMLDPADPALRYPMFPEVLGDWSNPVACPPSVGSVTMC